MKEKERDSEIMNRIKRNEKVLQYFVRIIVHATLPDDNGKKQ